MPDEDVAPGLPNRRGQLPAEWSEDQVDAYLAAREASTERWLIGRQAIAAEARKKFAQQIRDRRNRELLAMGQLGPKTEFQWPAGTPAWQRDGDNDRRGRPPRIPTVDEIKQVLKKKSECPDRGYRTIAAMLALPPHLARQILARWWTGD